MNYQETVKLLALMSAMDRRTIGDAEVLAWQGVLDDVNYGDAAEAVRQHYRENDNYLMPVHVRRGAQEIAEQRAAAERATPWAPGQYGVLRENAMPEVAGPVDENTLTPPVRALLESVRAMLPEGSKETLMPRTVYWEREHAAYVRTRDAEPNPLYRPRIRCTDCSFDTNSSERMDTHAGETGHMLVKPKAVAYCANCGGRCEGQHGPCLTADGECTEDQAQARPPLEEIRQVCENPHPDCRSGNPCQAEGPHWWQGLATPQVDRECVVTGDGHCQTHDQHVSSCPASGHGPVPPQCTCNYSGMSGGHAADCPRATW